MIALPMTDDDPRILNLVFKIGDTPQHIMLTEKEAINYIITSMYGGPHYDLGKAFGAVKSVKSYRRLLQHAAKSHGVSYEFREQFHTAWTVRGFRWRDALNNDALLARALRSVLNSYDGEAQTLFRGEQAVRYDAGRLGFNWTSERKVAEMFASGLCSSYEGGGVLLTATVPATAIIAAPGSHSLYLGEQEFIIDPREIDGVIELKRFPAR